MRLKLCHGKLLNSSFMHKVCGWPVFYESLKGSSQKLRHRETKKFDKIVIPYHPKIFRYQNISETQGSPYEFFRYWETKRIDKIVIPLLSKNFCYQNISETQKGSTTLFFDGIGTKKIDGKTWHPPSINFFRIRAFLKDKSVPPRSFSVLWDKNNR